MAWTAIIGPEEAQGELKELYDALEARGITLTAEFLGVYTQEPGILRWLTAGLKPGYGATAIETTLTQMIAIVVSVVNGCGNCRVIHGELMRRMLADDALADQILEDYTQAPLEPAVRAALDYAVKLTREPRGVTEADVQRLREEGYTDQQIVDVAHVAAWFNYVNRIALGLGTQLRTEAGARPGAGG